MIRLNRRQWFIVRQTQRRGSIQNADVRRVWKVSAEAIRQDLCAMVESGVLQRRGRCKGTFYVLGDLAVLQNRRTRPPERG